MHRSRHSERISGSISSTTPSDVRGARKEFPIPKQPLRQTRALQPASGSSTYNHGDLRLTRFEPPNTEPYVRWCGRTGPARARAYPIRTHNPSGPVRWAVGWASALHFGTAVSFPNSLARNGRNLSIADYIIFWRDGTMLRRTKKTRIEKEVSLMVSSQNA
jgi:hypothetical protein